MNLLPIIKRSENELSAVFEDLHAHPEIGFEEFRTSEIVARILREYGVDEIHAEIGGTGVVGIINGKYSGDRRVGLRADMDALPIDESTGLPYASIIPGKMHACGHDSHTTMLLGAAKHLATTRKFKGQAILIFQPAEEGLGGARKMIKEGLFKRFPCDEIFGMHNSPNGKPGTFEICKGTAMAGASFFDIDVVGVGSHAASPQNSRDAVVISSFIVSQLQTIVSRNISPLDSCVISVTQIHTGSAYNIIPETAKLTGTVRYFKDDVSELANEHIKTVCHGIAKAFDAKVKVDIRKMFDVLWNDATLADAYLDAAKDILGEYNVSETFIPRTGSEDFADMLRIIPGAYCLVGHSGTIGLHSPNFRIGREVIAIGASIMARLIEKRLSI